MLKNKSGISLTILVITVMIIFIILGTLVYSSVDSINIKKLNKLYNDLRQLNDAVEVYYLRNGKLPIDESKGTIVISLGDTRESLINKKIEFVLKDSVTDVVNQESFFNPNDYVYTADGTSGEATYEFLKLDLLENLSLNYGNNDFIINTQSHTIYNCNGVKIKGKKYNMLPLKYKDTKYNEKHQVSNIRLKSIRGITNGNNIYFAYSTESLNIKDLLIFDSNDEKNDGLGEPKELEFLLSVNSEYYTVNENGMLIRKPGVVNNNVSDTDNYYITSITVTAKNYGSSSTISQEFDIYTSSINIYKQISDSNLDFVDHINLVKDHEESIYKSKKITSEQREYKVQKNGYLSTLNPEINVISEDNEIATAIYNNNNNTTPKYIVFESGTKTGSTDITLESQIGGLARDIVTVNVYDFEVCEVLSENILSKDRLDFKGLGDDHKKNIRLNTLGPNIDFSAEDNNIEWTIVEDDGDTPDDSGIVSFSIDNDLKNIEIKPLKIGRTNLKCKITVENEVVEEILIPITVSGIERINGGIIENDAVRFSTNVDNKTITIKYVFGDNTINSAIYENPTINPSNNFEIVKNNDNSFTITYNKASEISAEITLVANVDDKEYKDSISFIVYDRRMTLI